MVKLLPLVLIAALAGFYFAFGDRFKSPKVGVADLPDDTQRAPLRVLHQALVSFADKRVSRERQQGIAKRLEMGGSKMKASEWIVMVAIVTFVVLLVGITLVHWLIGIVAAGMTVAIANFLLTRKVDKRQKVFGQQLGEALGLLSGGLRAGLSLQQALNLVATEAPAPSGDEYRRVLAENRLGRDMTDALYAMANRIGSEDFEWVVGAIDINRQAGGDLSKILDRVGETIRARERVRGQVRALSAEGRLSGMVMGALPPGVMVIVSVMNPEYLDGFTKTGPTGWALLVVALFLLLCGIFWLKKLTKFTY
ncbi:MAG: type II secretion system F family protein [Acidimicrobiia bacterium]|nr:type II secretion system F family protein [Acidimicrobiia bacterium]